MTTVDQMNRYLPTRRLARDIVIAAMTERLVQRNGGRIVAADGTGNGDGPEAQLMRNVINAFAEYERQLIRARTKTALAVKRSKGERTSRWLPYGYRLQSNGTHLEPEPDEQRTITTIRAWRVEGLSIRAITAKLNDEGYPARGKCWHKTSVSRLLEAEVA